MRRSSGRRRRMSTAVVGAGGAEVGELEAVGDELHHAADGGGRDAVLRGAAAIDRELPVDAGGGQAVGDVDHVGDAAQRVGHAAGDVVEAGGIDGGELDLDRLAGRRAGGGHRDLDVGAGDAGHAGAELVEDGVGALALAPVDELVLDHADHVLGDVAAALAGGAADAGIDRLDAGPAEDARLGLADQRVLFLDRQVAAGVDVEQAVVRLDVGEELDPGAVLAVGHRHRHEERDRGEEHQQRVADGAADDRHVDAVAGLVVRRGLGEMRAEGRGEDQRVEHRGRERRDQRDRHVLHELADDPRPEEQRREGGDAGQRGGDHRAGHPLGGELEGRLARHALGHPALGELGDDDRVVDQHADREDQAEEHDDVDGQPRHRQQEDADQERDRDREADQDRGAAREREEDDDEDQHHRGQHAVLQVGEELADVGRLVLAEADLRARRASPRRRPRRRPSPRRRSRSGWRRCAWRPRWRSPAGRRGG